MSYEYSDHINDIENGILVHGPKPEPIPCNICGEVHNNSCDENN